MNKINLYASHEYKLGAKSPIVTKILTGYSCLTGFYWIQDVSGKQLSCQELPAYSCRL